MKTLIVIPAFNEEKNLPSLVKEIKGHGFEYLIINDSSTDGTSELAKASNFNILNLPINMGLAGVTRIGFMYAKYNNYDCVVCIDGDGQHDPKYISSLTKEIENGNDYVIGSRFVDKRKKLSMRMIGSSILTFLIKVKTGKTIKDPTSGMRALSKKVIDEFADSMNYYAEPDAVTHLIKKGYKVKEVKVEMMDRQNGESYFISPFKSIKFMVSEVISILLVQW